jgi:serine/threonine protein kinase
MDSISQKPEFVNDRSDDLAAARAIRAAAIAARTAGSIDTPLSVLTDSQLDAPIGEADADPWERKQLLIHGYAVGSEIGSGGQATVYCGTQEATGRRVAIKVIPGGPFVSSRRRARFDREAKLLASLDHPNVVGILDRGRADDGSFFIVMELIEGLPLDQYWITLNQNPEAVARLFVKIAGAVDEAHQRGIVHRDLKPSNIRVDRRGEPHVLDFGLARMNDAMPDDSMHRSITHSGQIIGSLPWSSPEQAKHGEEAVDCRSDVYSLGVMLYQAIAGKFPYKIDGSLGDILRQIATTNPCAPSKLRADQPKRHLRALDEITLKALAKNPVERYSSAGYLAGDLENFLAGRPIQIHPRRRLSRFAWIKYAFSVLLLGSVVAWAGARNVRNANTQPVVADLPKSTGRAGITFVRIPAGTALIGSLEKEQGHRADETRHTITIERPFWISTTLVTQVQFSSVMGFNPSDPKFLGNSLPVQCTTWYEAQEFCRRLGSSVGRRYRLPTEAEWEYACRATEPSPFGNGLVLSDVGWWAGNSGATLHPVGTKQPNFWGLYDMHGDVAEWCMDSYGTFTAVAATDGISKTHSDRVVRGGSFLSPQVACRAAARDKAPPETRSPGLGFRVVCEDAVTPPGGRSNP